MIEFYKLQFLLGRDAGEFVDVMLMIDRFKINQ